MIKFIVTCVECNDSNDGHPVVLGRYQNKEDAISYIELDMQDRIKDYRDQHDNEEPENIDFDRHEITFCDGNYAIWDVLEVEND